MQTNVGLGSSSSLSYFLNMQIADLSREVFGFAAEMHANAFRVVERWKFISEKLDSNQNLGLDAMR
jgi:hypothetical protein